jgi:hypothetical protein
MGTRPLKHARAPAVPGQKRLACRDNMSAEGKELCVVATTAVQETKTRDLSGRQSPETSPKLKTFLVKNLIGLHACCPAVSDACMREFVAAVARIRKEFDLRFET